MWWYFITPLTTVQLGTTVGIYRETFVRIDGHTEKTGVSLETQITIITTEKSKSVTSPSIWDVETQKQNRNDLAGV